MDRAELRDRVTSCGLNGCSQGPSSFTGPDQADVAVITERPGIDPPALDLFRNQLTRAGFDWSQLAFTSLVACSSDPGRPPGTHEVEACTDNRKMQLWFIKPRYVLLAGNVPLQVYRPDLNVSKAHGRPFQIVYGDDKPVFFPIYNPSAVQRNQAWRAVTDSDLLRFAEIVHGDGHWTWQSPDTCTECNRNCVDAGVLRYDAMGFTYCEVCIKGVT